MRDLISSVLSNAVLGLKLKPTEREKLRTWKTDLELAQRDNHDRLQNFKDELRKLEARALKLHDERAREKSGVLKKVVTRELEQVCLELAQKEGRMDVLFENLKRQAGALDKIAELEEALHRGVSEAQADDLALDLEDAFSELERADAAMRGAGDVSYRKTEAGKVDVEKQVREIRGEPPVLSPAANSVMARLRRPKADAEEA